MEQNTNPVPPNMNHGGHEIFDVHDAIGANIDTLNQFLILKEHVKCQELLGIINRQTVFLQDEYNLMVQSFQTGQNPPKHTGRYAMQEGNNFIYGLKPSQPKKPMQNVSEINEEYVSGRILGSLKTMATGKAMAALETTNPVLRRVLADSVPNNIEMAYEVSIYMNQKGYYQVAQLAQPDMQQLLGAFGTVQSS